MGAKPCSQVPKSCGKPSGRSWKLSEQSGKCFGDVNNDIWVVMFGCPHNCCRSPHHFYGKVSAVTQGMATRFCRWVQNFGPDCNIFNYLMVVVFNFWMHCRAVMILDFHYTIIVAKRIHNNNIIISIEHLKKEIIIMPSVKLIFNFVY